MIPTRRDVLRLGAGGGAAALLRVPVLAAAANAATAGPAFAPNAWVRIAGDGKVSLVVGHSEMGQGVRTSLAMILADELGADWSAVAIEQASPGPEYQNLSTGGSDSVEDGWVPLRKAAAAAREMLVAAAAKIWKASAADCRAEAGAVVHVPTGRRLSFGRLARAAAPLPVPKEPRLKERAELTLVGTPVRRVDGPAIVAGGARYGLDVRIPGMRYAAVARCPTPGGRPVRFDAAKARAVAGVRRVLEVSTGVAVVADDTWSALRGRDALAVEWDAGPNAGLTTERLWSRIDAAFGAAMRVTRREGDAAGALAAAGRRMSATYRDSFQAHASVEPQNTVARVANGRCELWTPTQHPQRVQKETAKLLGIPESRVTVHVTLLGGGFGRRLGADYATEAAEVARAAAGVPVQVVWSREDDFAGDWVHPGARVDLDAALDESGGIVAWRHRAATLHLSMFGAFDPNEPDDPNDVSPWGGFDTPYAFPRLAVEYRDVESPVRTGAWRSVFYPPNVFARESFLDEIAAATGRDSVALRRELLTAGDPVGAAGPWKLHRARLERVVALAAEKAGWGTPVSAPAGRRAGRGVACNVYHGRTCLAQVAEVSVGATGDVRVHRVVTAADCGVVVNPLGLAGQVESGVAWGISYALGGEVTYRGGAIEQASYSDYPVLRYGGMPEIEVHTVDSDRPPLGFGEQPVPCVAPAVANAVFAATGRRVRRLPIRPADLA
jgi:isoquinoline 1-oxidoreductase beta subunit